MTPGPEQHRAMHRLWHRARVAERVDRLALTAAIVGRRVESSNDLTSNEARRVLAYLQQLDDEGSLAHRATAYLEQHVWAKPTPVTAEVVDPDELQSAMFDLGQSARATADQIRRWDDPT